MVLADDDDLITLDMFKKQVIRRLAFLGLPQGDVAKLVDLCADLVPRGAQASKADMKRLVKMLARSVGKPRANLFVKWLIERTPEVSCSHGAASCQQPSVLRGQETLTVPQNSSGSAVLEAAVTAQSAGASEVQQPVVQSAGASESQRPQPASHSDAKGLPDGPIVITSTAAKASAAAILKQEHSTDRFAVDDALVAVKSKDGKMYYWNRSTNQCCWTLPAGIRAKWTSQKSPEGRSYYFDDGGHSVWVLPPLQTSPVVAKKCSAPGSSAAAATQVQGCVPAPLQTNAPAAKEAPHLNRQVSAQSRSRSPRRTMSADKANLKTEEGRQQLPGDWYPQKRHGDQTIVFEALTVFEYKQHKQASSGGA
jgi:hypothetical protein